MADGVDVPLTNRQIQRLGDAISRDDMESFALGYLDIDNAIIKNMKREETAEAFNREVLFRWRNKNPKYQVTVMYYTVHFPLFKVFVLQSRMK